MSHKEIIEKINVVAFEVTSVSGTISRDAADDPMIYTAGSVRYIDPKHLRAFAAARQAANRLCRTYGVRFLSGWAVPDKNLDMLVAELSKIAQEVELAKSSLGTNWDALVDEWKGLNPAVCAYSARFPSKEYADRQTGARLSVYRIQPQEAAVEHAATAMIQDGIQSEVKGLAARVLSEIAQDVQDTWNPSASAASQRIKNLLSRIQRKFQTLEFLGGGLGNLAAFVEQAIQRLPTSGGISGPDFAVLAGILGILSSPEKMAETARMVEASGLEATEDLFAPPPAPKQVVDEPKEVATEVAAISSAAVVQAPTERQHEAVPETAEIAESPADAWAW